MGTCLIYVLSHLMPEEVRYAPKVLRKIRVEKAYTVTRSAPPTSHFTLGKTETQR